MFNYDKFEQAIAESGKTKTYLCARVGRPAYYLRDVLRQKNSIPREYQEVFAKELGVSLGWLNDETDEKKPAPTNGDELSQDLLIKRALLIDKLQHLELEELAAIDILVDTIMSKQK